MGDPPSRPVDWVASSCKDDRAFPDPVQDAMGFALYQAQLGGMPDSAKPLKANRSRDLAGLPWSRSSRITTAMPIGRFIRVKFAKVIYVLHAFQKKSRKGIKTPQGDIELIERRLKVAEQDYKARYGGAA